MGCPKSYEVVKPLNKLLVSFILVTVLILMGLVLWGLPTSAAGLKSGASGPVVAGPAIESASNGLSGQENLQPSSLITLYTYLPVMHMKAGYKNPFGVTMYGGISDSGGRQAMAQAGTTIVTTNFDWSIAEPTAPVGGSHSYNWSVSDAKFGAAAEVGMDIFVLFTGNPSWAAQYPGGPLYSGRIDDLKSFLSAAVERYDGDGIDDAPGSPVASYWSFYAEPDNGDVGRAISGKGYWGHNGAGYAALLAEVYPVIKAANPNAQVLIGGLAYAWFEDQGGPFVRDFLPSVLSAMKRDYGWYYIDAFAFHYYPINTDEHPTIASKAYDLRDILTSYGLVNLPMVVPEMGYWGTPGNASSEENQAKRLVQMYARGLATGLGQMSWHSVFDWGDPITQPYEQHGLFRGQDLNNPKPAYYAYKTLAAELNWYSYIRKFKFSGIEGYVFYYSPAHREKTVLWATGSTRVVPFSGALLRVVDKVGNETIIADGSTRDRDTRAGVIGIEVSSSPVYVVQDP
jgi:hypothetical protein